MSILLQDLREEIVFYGRQLLTSGLTMHTGGNLSARDRKTGLVVIKPSSVAYDKLTAEDVTVITLDGQIVDGNFGPSSEWPMHTMIYKHYPRVCGIVHCHSLMAIAFSAANMEIPLANHELSVYCSSPVRVAPFEMPGSEELGKSAIQYLGDDNNAVLLGNHGPLGMGASLWHAFDTACAIEQAATIAFYARQLGNFQPVPVEGRLKLRSCDPLTQPDTGDLPVEIKAV